MSVIRENFTVQYWIEICCFKKGLQITCKLQTYYYINVYYFIGKYQTDDIYFFLCIEIKVSKLNKKIKNNNKGDLNCAAEWLRLKNVTEIIKLMYNK